METNEQLEAMLGDYAKSIAPKFTPKATTNIFDPKNYFTIYDLKDDEQSKTKEIRILPNPNGGSPIVPFKGHTAYVDGKKQTFACLKHVKNEPCPFCEARDLLLSGAGKSEEELKKDKELAKDYRAIDMYIVKLIDRNNEEDGPKFWRFKAAYDKKGAYDMIMGTVNGLKKNKAIMDPNEGRDLSVIITRNEKKVPIITSVVAQDSDVLSPDPQKQADWLADTRTWESVYSVKSYDYLEIVVKGGIPVWDKELKQFVDKNGVTPKTSTKDSESDEIVMGLENVKTSILTSATEITEENYVNDDDGDDLPF